MVELADLRDDELARRGRAALKSGKHRAANEMLGEYCDRQLKEEHPISGGILADYALSVAYLGDHKEAAEVCFRALALDRRNADAYAALARIYTLGRSRRKAVEAMERGLAISPRHAGLNAMRDELGVRRQPFLPFLSRDHRWNVLLGRLIERFRSKGHDAA
jgi:tetratricopeptide (TPR) repeat protein